MDNLRRATCHLRIAIVACMSLAGCAGIQAPSAMPPAVVPAAAPVGSELSMVALPTYDIQPPDILEIDAVRIVPKSPYRIEALDYLGINAYNPAGNLTELGEQPIIGTYGVEPGGAVSLGPSYGRVQVAGLTLDEAADKITRQLSRKRKGIKVAVTLTASSGLQQIQGQHRVGPDGTVNLGEYGTVFVTGMTIEQARHAIEQHLTKFLDDPEVSVDVYNYASKKYYVVEEGAGLGDPLLTLQITGNDTVLGAISQLNGLSKVSTKHIWIARPTPDGRCFQRLEVNWNAITKRGETQTDYQIMPGDRIVIGDNKFIAADSFVNKVLDPIERIFGFSSLAATSVEQIKHPAEFFAR